MTTEKLIEFLQTHEKKDILLNLQGIIITKMVIEKMQLMQKEKQLLLLNKENEEQSMGFNLSQLMRITKIMENEILLEFDQLQSVTIKIENTAKKAIYLKEK